MEKEFVKNILNEVVTELQMKQIISEGLIMTHDIKKVANILKRYVYNNFYIFVDYENWIIELTPKTVDKKIDGIIKVLNNMGYFISSFTKKGQFIGSEYPKNDWDSVIFESKYDKEFKTNGIPLYHVTEKIYLNKILKDGLIPKTKSKLTYHPERIYLTNNPISAMEIFNIFKDGGYIKDPIMLKIDTFDLYNKFMVDRQFPGGIYTYDNIPPNKITINK